MTREEAKKIAKIYEGIAADKEIEFVLCGGPREWHILNEGSYDHLQNEAIIAGNVRVKPVSRVIPYNNMDAIIGEIAYCGKERGWGMMIIGQGDCYVLVGNRQITYRELFDKYTHIDGRPFGKSVLC